MDASVKRIGDVTIERVPADKKNKHDAILNPMVEPSSLAMNTDSELGDSDDPLTDDDELISDTATTPNPPSIDTEHNPIHSSLKTLGHLDHQPPPSTSSLLPPTLKRKHDDLKQPAAPFLTASTSNFAPKKTKPNLPDGLEIKKFGGGGEGTSDKRMFLGDDKGLRTTSELNTSDEDTEYDSEEETDDDALMPGVLPKLTGLEPADKVDFIEKLAELGETSQKSEDTKLDNSDYDYDITEKLKEMGEISVETVKKGDKPRKPESTSTETAENEISVTPAIKKESDSDSEDKNSSERKIGNLRRNIREVMDETQLDEATLAAQRQEMERLRRVQEQQRIIREVQKQIALNRQNNKTQHRVISLLQGNSSSLIKHMPGTSGSTPQRVGNTVLVKLPNGETKPMTRITKGQTPFEVVRLQKGPMQGNKMQRSNLIPLKRPGIGNLTPSVSIAPVAKKFEPKTDADSDEESEESDREKKFRKVAGKQKDVVTISSSSDDDCIVLSEDEPDEPEPDEDPCNSGMHTNDAYNVPDEQGRVIINVGHPENESEVFLAPQIARVIKPHQIGGVRFLFDNVIESTDRFSTSTGFGCILAHSMGLGKTLQVVCFSDIFLRHTPAKTILCIMPINTLQNWMAEFNMWLPKDPSNSPLLNNGEVRPRNFNIYVLNDSHKTLTARAKVIHEWHTEGGVLMIGYELFRLLSLRRNPKSKAKRKKVNAVLVDRPDTPEDDEKNKNMFEEIHEALVKPGPDLVICDEGHRIKNSHASISHALKQIRSKRRIVLTGYPLQNNLLEYWCMVDFVRPNYLGTKTEFSNMFERPIQNGQCIDSTPQDIRLMRYRAHVLHSLLEGFVQRRSHAVLQTSLPQKEEYVLLVRMTEFQRKLYDTFMNEVVRTKTVPNPLKAFAVCCKIWNHPDVLYYFLKKRTTGEAVDIDLEEVAGAAVATPVAGTTTPAPATPKKSRARGGGAKKERKPAASRSKANANKPAASVTPNTNVTTIPSTTTTTTPNTLNPQQPMAPNQPGMLPNQQGFIPSQNQPGMVPSQQGMLPNQPGMMQNPQGMQNNQSNPQNMGANQQNLQGIMANQQNHALNQSGMGPNQNMGQNQQPMMMSNQPNHLGPNQPQGMHLNQSMGQNQANIGQNQPNMGQNQQNMGQNQQNMGQNQQNMGQNQPNMGQNQQNMGQNQPNMGQNQPNMGQNQPNMGQNQQNMGQNQQNMGQNQQNMAQNQPNMGQNQPNMGQNQPNMGQNQTNLSTPPGQSSNAIVPANNYQQQPPPSSNYQQPYSNYQNYPPPPQYNQSGDYYNPNQPYPNNYQQPPGYYPPNPDYTPGFYDPNAAPPGGQTQQPPAYPPDGQNYWQNQPGQPPQQTQPFYNNPNSGQPDYYNQQQPPPQQQQPQQQQQQQQQPQGYNQDYYRPNYNPGYYNNQYGQQWPPGYDDKGDGHKQEFEVKVEVKEEVKKEEDKVNFEQDLIKKEEIKDDPDEKSPDIIASGAKVSIKEDTGIPYDWAAEFMKGYIPGCIENSAKMEIFFCILQESMALGDRILLFSQSLFTLNLIEEFLQRYEVPGTQDKWARNKHYYRLDGSTSALEREKLINEYNSNPNIHLFLVSTRAGSLGINLVGANRVIVFDASWNPCHDTQAVCRVYRYGQKKPCFVYRIVMDNCLEKKIYDRQINKQGMADRVVDECNPDAHLSMKDVTNLCWDDEKDSEVKDFSTNKDKYIDVVMQKVLDAFSNRLSKEPFQHESLLIDRKEKKLSQAEKRLAKRSYELEKQANISSRPTYGYYNGSGQGLQIRAIRNQDGSMQNKPVASVRPMQSEQMNINRNAPGQPGRSRWIPAEVWQRQGMTAQEMTLPLDVVIPTNSPDRGSIVLKAGQKVLVLKSPKGIYMQLECGKIVAIKTAFKVRGAGGKAGEKGDESTPNKEPGGAPTTILKKLPPGAGGGNTSKLSGNVPLPLKNNSAITVIPKGVGGQQRVVKPFAQGLTKLSMRSIRQPVPNLIGRQMQMRMGNPRFTGKIHSVQRKVQLGKAKPYNLDKLPGEPSKSLDSLLKPDQLPERDTETPETHTLPSSDEDFATNLQRATGGAPERKDDDPDDRFQSNEMYENESMDPVDLNRFSDRRQSTDSYQSSGKLSSTDSFTNLDQFGNSDRYPSNFSNTPERFGDNSSNADRFQGSASFPNTPDRFEGPPSISSTAADRFQGSGSNPEGFQGVETTPERFQDTGSNPDEFQRTGPPSDRFQGADKFKRSGNDSTEGFQSTGMPGERFQAAGAPLERFQSAGSTQERFQNTATTPERFQNAGPTLERFSNAGTTPERYQSAGTTPERFQSSETTSERFQSAGNTPERFQSTGHTPERFQSTGNTTERFQSTGNNAERFQSTGNTAERFQNTGSTPERFQNTPERFQNPGNAPERFQSTGNTPDRFQNNPERFQNTPERFQSPGNGPERFQSPGNGPERFQSPGNGSERFQSPSNVPERFQNPGSNPERLQNTVPTSDRFQSTTKPPELFQGAGNVTERLQRAGITLQKAGTIPEQRIQEPINTPDPATERFQRIGPGPERFHDTENSSGNSSDRFPGSGLVSDRYQDGGNSSERLQDSGNSSDRFLRTGAAPERFPERGNSSERYQDRYQEAGQIAERLQGTGITLERFPGVRQTGQRYQGAGGTFERFQEMDNTPERTRNVAQAPQGDGGGFQGDGSPSEGFQPVDRFQGVPERFQGGRVTPQGFQRGAPTSQRFPGNFQNSPEKSGLYPTTEDTADGAFSNSPDTFQPAAPASFAGGDNFATAGKFGKATPDRFKGNEKMPITIERLKANDKLPISIERLKTAKKTSNKPKILSIEHISNPAERFPVPEKFQAVTKNINLTDKLPNRFQPTTTPTTTDNYPDHHQQQNYPKPAEFPPQNVDRFESQEYPPPATEYQQQQRAEYPEKNTTPAVDQPQYQPAQHPFNPPPPDKYPPFNPTNPENKFASNLLPHNNPPEIQFTQPDRSFPPYTAPPPAEPFPVKGPKQTEVKKATSAAAAATKEPKKPAARAPKSRSLKNYRHNFAGQKAVAKTKNARATSSALHQLEQTTSSIGENKQPFQESLDNITNSYGQQLAEKDEANIIDLDGDKSNEIPEKPNKTSSKSQQSPLKPSQSPTIINEPSKQLTQSLPPTPTLLPQPTPAPIPSTPQINPESIPHSQPTAQAQDYGYNTNYYGYNPHAYQPPPSSIPPLAPPPPQGYYAPPTVDYPPDVKPVNPATKVENKTNATTGSTTTTTQSVPETSSSSETPTAAPPQHPGYATPTPGFPPYGYDMNYPQHTQYPANYSGIPYPNQSPYQPPYQPQYDQPPYVAPGTPGAPYSAFHRPEMQFAPPPTGADPYAQPYMRNPYPPPPPHHQYPYPQPPGAPPQPMYGAQPGVPAPGYEYQYPGGFGPPPPTFGGPYPGGLPGNNNQGQQQ